MVVDCVPNTVAGCPDEKKNSLSDCESSEALLKAAICTYSITVIATWFILILFLGIRGWGAFIVALVAGQVIINFMCFPTNINIYSEFTSWSALYTLIQLATPLIVYVYAIVMAWEDRVSHKHPVGVALCNKGYTSAVELFSPKKKKVV